MKTVIQRNLPLDVKYDIVSVSYQSLEDGGGCSCDNCGRLITNIGTVKSTKGVYNIGLDCLDTLLVNNDLLTSESHLQYMFSDKPAIQRAKSLRSKLLKQLKTDIHFVAEYGESSDGLRFGFDFVSQYDNGSIRRLGYDYTYRMDYKELTLNYLKGLTNIKF